jgi:phosphatidyl-myo-inositol dimannoside synthase
MPSDVLVLLPSVGRGGGIEAYAAGLIGAIRTLEITVWELPLVSPDKELSISLKVAYLVRVLRAALSLRGRKVEVLCLHPGLLPVALLARITSGLSRPVTCFSYGIDIWGGHASSGRYRRHQSVRSVTISSFSAGALSFDGPTFLLPPAVEPKRYEGLVAIDRSPEVSPEIMVLSVFRLEDYAKKGGPELVSAVLRLREQGFPFRLTIGGVDATNTLLDSDLECHAEWMRIVRSPDTKKLISLFAESDLFVLASRHPPEGEGFGIVLAEAALAGLPVVAPSNDGSSDAFIPGITGLRPRDQSIDDLSEIMQWLAEHPKEMRMMGRNGRIWAEKTFDPVGYPSRVQSILWGHGNYENWLGVELALQSDTIAQLGRKAQGV